MPAPARIYGAALERESLTEIYGPAYLLGVGPTHETATVCGRRSMALPPGWNSSTLQPMGRQPLSQERKALTSVVPGSRDAGWLRMMALPTSLVPAALSGGPERLDTTNRRAYDGPDVEVQEREAWGRVGQEARVYRGRFVSAGHLPRILLAASALGCLGHQCHQLFLSFRS